MTKVFNDDRRDAWFDGSSICVVAVGAFGDPLDLGEEAVEELIEKLRKALGQSKAS